jgi:hypothetical protein
LPVTEELNSPTPLMPRLSRSNWRVSGVSGVEVCAAAEALPRLQARRAAARMGEALRIKS